MSLPPLNRLRKGVFFFSLFLLIFIFYRLVFFKTEQHIVPPYEHTQNVTTEMCLLIGSSGPINVDTVFNLQYINKIFAYSSFRSGFNSTDTLLHYWYYGSELVKKTECVADGSACTSSISADSLYEGGWSVDVRQGDILLDTKQFSVHPPK